MILFKKISLTLFVFFIAITAMPQDLKEINISIAQMPVVSENTEKGQFVDLVKAIARVSGVKLKLQVAPFVRSMDNAITGKVDAHMPMMKSPYIKEKDLDYDLSTVTLYEVNFVLYTNKNKKINMNNLKNYKIETDMAHVGYFNFPVIASTDIVGSLQKVNAGRIDGFIFADFTSDSVIKEKGLKNIKREFYKQFEVKFVLPKGQKGKDVDKLLSKAVAQLKKTGELTKILSPVDAPYNNWQP
jgi:polar amino acid transport system substrate-binding protein